MGRAKPHVGGGLELNVPMLQHIFQHPLPRSRNSSHGEYSDWTKILKTPM
jgi:hypothetical protein